MRAREAFGDFFFALRYRQAFEDIRRREQELEEELRRARAQSRQGQQGESEAQRQWRREQEQQRARKAEEAARQKQEKSAGSKTQENARQGDGQQRNERTTGTAYTQPPPDELRAKHLRTLGLDPREVYGFDELKSAYRKALKRTHPDAGGSAVEFIAVQNAWEWFKKSS